MSEGGIGMYPQPGRRSRWSEALGEWIEEDAPEMTTDPARDARELLPCPFCGDQAEIEPKNWAGRDFIGVFCKECLIFQDSRSSTNAEAITAWNTRALAARGAGDGERLRSDMVWLIDGLGFDPFGTCPICSGTEGCSHTLRERIRAALSEPRPSAGEDERAWLIEEDAAALRARAEQESPK